MTIMNLPKLSTYHTIEASQNSVDPLGLVSLSGKLANLLLPGIRERMKHPRYLTAMAVGAVICSAFNEDELAIDEITPPWQVYEWYAASSLVKRFEKEDPEQLFGMPGRLKTSYAMRKGVLLSKNTYLTNPSIGGFHGVYRTLAKNMNVIEDNDPGEFGMLLLDAWETEQHLDGFQRGARGSSGQMLKHKLQGAVTDGLLKGSVDRNWNWDIYKIMADSLAPKRPGKQEARLLFEELKNGSSGKRHEMIDFLLSAEGQYIFENKSEQEFHSALINFSGGIAPILKAIKAYEKFCTLLFNSFYEILQSAWDNQKKGTLETFSILSSVKKAVAELPSTIAEITELMETFTDEAGLFHESFSTFVDPLTLKDFVRVLFEHHNKIQRNRLPNPKAPWLIEHESNSYLINTLQEVNRNLKEGYVHLYRTSSLQSFMLDLGKV